MILTKYAKELIKSDFPEKPTWGYVLLHTGKDSRYFKCEKSPYPFKPTYRLVEKSQMQPFICHGPIAESLPTIDNSLSITYEYELMWEAGNSRYYDHNTGKYIIEIPVGHYYLKDVINESHE